MKPFFINLLFIIVGISIGFNELFAQSLYTRQGQAHRCTNFIVDVTLGGNSYDLNENIASLSVMLHVRNEQPVESWQIRGEAHVVLDEDMVACIDPQPHVYTSIVRNLLRNALRDAFEKLQNVLQNHYETWKGTVMNITPDGNIIIQTTPSDNVREGDIFHIFSGYGDFIDTPCSFVNNRHRPITAKIINIDENISTLQVIDSPDSQESLPVQIGDFVELSEDDSEDYSQRRREARKLLELGFMGRPVLSFFRVNGTFVDRCHFNISSFFMDIVLEESNNSGFTILF